MREIVLSSDLLGLDFGIAIREIPRSVRWRPEGSYVVGQRNVDAVELPDMLSVFGESVEELIPEAFVKAYSMYLGTTSIPWLTALGRERFIELVSSYRDRLLPIVNRIEKHAYFETLIAGRSVLQSLEPPHVDPTVVEQSLDEHENVTSLRPTKGQVCKQVRYAHDTSTGRLRVVAGPKVLTLPQKLRRAFVSRFGPSGRLVSIDFVSLEPRVALAAIGKHVAGDVYACIAG